MEGTSNQSIYQHDGNKYKIYYNCNWHILFENYYLKICVPKTMTILQVSNAIAKYTVLVLPSSVIIVI